MSKIKRLLFSDIIYDSTHTQKLAYIAVMTALCVVCNMFFEFKLADTQFSLTIFFSALTGMVIGPLFGFVACFLDDLVGFLYNSGGFMYMPWIGLSMGLVALISGLVMNCIEFKNKFAVNGAGKKLPEQCAERGLDEYRQKPQNPENWLLKYLCL